MSKKTHKGTLLFFVTSLLLMAIGSYFWFQMSTLPFGEFHMRGYRYLATEPSECKTCHVIEYYWTKNSKNECLFKKITTSTIWQNATITGAQTDILGEETLTAQQRLTAKGESPYLFDIHTYGSFQKDCHLFPESVK